MIGELRVTLEPQGSRCNAFREGESLLGNCGREATLLAHLVYCDCLEVHDRDECDGTCSEQSRRLGVATARVCDEHGVVVRGWAALRSIESLSVVYS